jgi:NAD(P)-dependent dehydrogenase (short-subunit alcohol dehydrogenase family)
MALGLAARGDLVVAVGRDPDRLAEVGRAMDEAGGGPHLTLRLDVASEIHMAELARRIEALGRVDLIVCSAAVGRGLGGRMFPPPTAELPVANWQAMVDVNLHGVFLANRAVLPLMLAQGDGDIVNIGSSTTPRGLRGTALAPAYAATKFALAEYGRQLADEVGPDGVRVHTIFPGPVETPLIADTMLDGPFGGRISGAHFTEALIGLIELGRAMDIKDPHLLPVPTRRKKTPRQPSPALGAQER